MIQMIVVVLFCIVGWGSGQFATTTVTITPNGVHTDVNSGEKTWYFWVSQDHRELFQVGKTYQLAADQQNTQWQLYSVTYAAIQPTSLRLGLQTMQDSQSLPIADEYQITPMQFIRTSSPCSYRCELGKRPLNQ